MSGLSQVALFHQLAHMAILFCLIKIKVGGVFSSVLTIKL